MCVLIYSLWLDPSDVRLPSQVWICRCLMNINPIEMKDEETYMMIWALNSYFSLRKACIGPWEICYSLLHLMWVQQFLTSSLCLLFYDLLNAIWKADTELAKSDLELIISILLSSWDLKIGQSCGLRCLTGKGSVSCQRWIGLVAFTSELRIMFF